jgi:hypothetical protein
VRLRAGELRTLRGGRVVLPVGIESGDSVRALSVRVRFDASALRVVRASAIGAARGALVVANATHPGELRLAIASGDAFLADGKPILAIVFDVLRGDRFAVPSVAVRLDDE